MNTARTDEQQALTIEYIKLPEVRRISGLSTTTIYRMAVAGDFPKQRKLGVKAVAWVRSEVEAWANTRTVAGQAPAATVSK
jgi:prophage regulatory protein